MISKISLADLRKENDAVFSLEEVLILEDIFKKRSIEAIDSRLVLQQYNGLNFLWMLGQIDAELAKEKRKQLLLMIFRS